MTAAQRDEVGGSRSFAAALALTAVVALAAATRIAYLFVVAADVDVSLDTIWYRLVSLQLSTGDGYVDPATFIATGAHVPTAQFPPGWPAVLAVGAHLGGRSVVAAQVTSCLVGALNVGLLAVLARRWLDGRAALVVAGVAAVHPTLVVVDATGLSETLFTTCTLAALVAITRDRHWAEAACCGLALGAGALVRGGGLVAAALVVAGLLIARRWRQALVVTAISLAVVAPWIVRNAVELDRLTVSDNSTGTIAGASCDSTWYGRGTGSWSFDCSSGSRREAFDHASDHLSRAPVVAGVRLLRTWGLWDPFPDWPGRLGEDLVGRDRTSHAVSWAVSLLTLPAAVIGGRRLLRADLRRAWALLVPIVHVSLVSILVYGNQRFRAPAEPILILFAVASVASLAVVDQRAGARSGSDAEARCPPTGRHRSGDRSRLAVLTAAPSARRERDRGPTRWWRGRGRARR